MAKSRANEDKKNLAHSLNSSGNLNLQLGEMEAAYNNYNEALSIWLEFGDTNKVAGTYNNIGLVLKSLGRYEQALSSYEKALVISRDVADKQQEVEALSNKGVALSEIKKYDQAISTYEQAINLSKELQDKAVETNNLINLAGIYNEINDLAKGEQIYLSALKNGYELENMQLIWPALLGLGDNYEKHEKFDKALHFYDQALSIVETMRRSLTQDNYKSSYFAQQRYIYEAIIHLLARLSIEGGNDVYLQRAFAYAEQAKARVFLDLINQSGYETSDQEDMQYRQVHNSLRLKIFDIDRKLNLTLISKDSLLIVSGD